MSHLLHAACDLDQAAQRDPYGAWTKYCRQFGPVWPSRLGLGPAPSPSLWLTTPLCLSVEHRSRSAPVHYSAPRTHLGPEALRCKPTTALVSRVLSAEAPPASIWLLELIPRRFIGAASRWATTATSMLRRSPSLRRIRSARQTPSQPAGRVSDAGDRAAARVSQLSEDSEYGRCCAHTQQRAVVQHEQ